MPYTDCNVFMHNMPSMHLWMKSMRNYMPYDLQEEKDQYIVEMPLPGFFSKDIEVSVRGTQIAIDAHFEGETPKMSEHHPPDPGRMGAYFWKRPIHVKIDVAEEIDPDQVKAKLKRGILHIEFAKMPKQTIAVDEEDE